MFRRRRRKDGESSLREKRSNIAFEQLCAAGKAEEDRKQQHHSEKEYDDEKKAGGGGGGKGSDKRVFDPKPSRNVRQIRVPNWTVLDVENMIRAYELSEARGEIIRINNHLDSKQNKEDVLLEVTEKGFREIVRKCGVREL